MSATNSGKMRTRAFPLLCLLLVHFVYAGHSRGRGHNRGHRHWSYGGGYGGLRDYRGHRVGYGGREGYGGYRGGYGGDYGGHGGHESYDGYGGGGGYGYPPTYAPPTDRPPTFAPSTLPSTDSTTESTTTTTTTVATTLSTTTSTTPSTTTTTSPTSTTTLTIPTTTMDFSTCSQGAKVHCNCYYHDAKQGVGVWGGCWPLGVSVTADLGFRECVRSLCHIEQLGNRTRISQCEVHEKFVDLCIAAGGVPPPNWRQITGCPATGNPSPTAPPCEQVNPKGKRKRSVPDGELAVIHEDFGHATEIAAVEKNSTRVKRAGGRMCIPAGCGMGHG